MSDIEELRAEIRRLQDILDGHGISYEVDPFDPALPSFGPPTEWEWRMSCLFRESSDRWLSTMSAQVLRDNVFLSGKEWSAEKLRVRLPTDFIVRSGA